MADIALLVPKEEMAECGRRLVKYEGYNVKRIKCINTNEAVNEAKVAVNSGINVIISEGIQALSIKKSTNVPVVEIKITAQEIGILIKNAKKLSKKDKPTIAIIGFYNMFSDMSYIETIFDIKLKTYFVEELDELHIAVENAVNDKADIIIGSDIVAQSAEIENVPCLFLSLTEDSIREAFKTAQNVCYAIELEKKNLLKLGTMLDYSFNGIIKINQTGYILAANQIIEKILSQKNDKLIGRHITEIVKEINIEQLGKVLNSGGEIYSNFIYLNNIPFIIIVVPTKINNKIDGAVLSFQKVIKKEDTNTNLLKETYVKDYVAKHKFEDILKKSKKMSNVVDIAKMYSLSKSPVLIYGETGTEKEILAEGIHNNSIRKNGPFVSVNCSGLTEQEQFGYIFGISENNENDFVCALRAANYGTLLINGIDRATLKCQQKLYNFIANKEYSKNYFSKKVRYDVRIITSCEKNLLFKMQEGNFRTDLYYILSSLSLEIPPLRERREDIGDFIDKYVKIFSDMYSKYHVLTEGAYNMLINYYWAGNLLQLKSFIERMILSSKHRTIDEVFVKLLIDEMYPVIHKEDNIERMIVYKNPEAVKISELLKKYNGNRTLVANELKVSKTTLWRYMKKFGIASKID